jgi:MFS family permease
LADIEWQDRHGGFEVTATPTSIKRTYYTLLLGNTLAASMIWGINTIFLLDAGLSNLEAFAANAFFTAGMVLFEVPTGLVADMWGRRASFLLGTVTLSVSTALYVTLWLVEAPFWQWAAVSLLLGLGFTFFSGATEAWLVDALAATGDDGTLEAVFGRGQVISGAGMLAGSVGGGYLAQVTNLGVPFVLRALILLAMFAVAYALMHDIGFTPKRDGRIVAEVRAIASDSIEYGWRIPAVRNLMLAGVFTGGVGIYVFYALQPYLLDLYGNPTAYGIAGLTAAIVAGAQIAGGVLATPVRRLFRRRTSALLVGEALAAVAVVLIGLVANFWAAIGLVVVWALVFAAASPIRQAYLNGLIPSSQRATILSFDSLAASSGGVAAQPVLGRTADVWGYPASYVLSGVLSAFALPFIARSRRENAPADTAGGEPAVSAPVTPDGAVPAGPAAGPITPDGAVPAGPVAPGVPVPAGPVAPDVPVETGELSALVATPQPEQSSAGRPDRRRWTAIRRRPR